MAAEARDFLVVVGGRDAERFRQFRTGEGPGAAALPRAAAGGAVRAWALSERMDSGAWERVGRGDRVFFAEHESPFTRCGIVLDTVTVGGDEAARMWGDSPRMRSLVRTMLFSAVREAHEQFSATCRRAGVTPSDSTFLYEARGGVAAPADAAPAGRAGAQGERAPAGAGPTGPALYEVRGGVAAPAGRADGQEGPAPTGVVVLSGQDDGPPPRAAEAVTRFVRDTAKVQRIKEMYRDECQVCGVSVQVAPDRRYSEVHHLHPLGDGGDDDYANMLVLCPTHHVEFDYAVSGVSRSGAGVVGRDGRTVRALTVVPGHALDPKNIAFQLGRMGLA